MILNRGQITESRIVSGDRSESRRSTTYDATIGEIVCEGSVVEGNSYLLGKRGIVWVVSSERFAFDDRTTGLATLKTSWTHKGLLALNVGVIDPGWDGPLATALVNFSGSTIQLKKGDPFFRVLFLQHERTSYNKVERSNPQYLAEIVERSRHFSDTFLHMDSLTDDVARNIFKLPKLAVGIGWAGIGIALAALLIPMGISVWAEAIGDRLDFSDLEKRIAKLEATRTSEDQSNTDATAEPETETGVIEDANGEAEEQDSGEAS